MSLDSDVIVDRRRIRRKLTFWRVVAAVIAIAAIVIVGVVMTPSGRGALTASGSIARINIEGLIRSDQARVEALEQMPFHHQYRWLWVPAFAGTTKGGGACLLHIASQLM